MTTQYIYQEPFNGRVLNTMHNGTVDYTGEPQRNEYTAENGSRVIETSYLNQLTFDQYNEQKGGNLKIASGEEIDVLLFAYENENVLTEFQEITEDQWWNWLECLPPTKWHHYKGLEIFFVSECYTSNIYRCCISCPDADKYYSALRRINETDEELETVLLQSIKLN